MGVDIISVFNPPTNNTTEEQPRFLLIIGDWMGKKEFWFKTEDELNNYLDEIDTTGLRVFAVEINRIIYNYNM